MESLSPFYAFVTSLSAALLIVPFLCRWAFDSGAVDTPNERKVHKEAIPRIGGIAIVMAFLFSLLAHAEFDHRIRGILAGTLVVFFTGLVDDLYGISPRRKFIGAAGGCVLTMVVGKLTIIHLGDLFGTGPIDLHPVLAIPFTIFAVVGVINAINLIDGLDGLAAGTSVIALAAFLLLAIFAGNSQVVVLSAGLLGALVGFLRFNFFPARIFMGDAGSLTIGFILAFTAIALTQAPGTTINPVVSLVILGLPIIDTLRVMLRRIIHGVSPFAADRTHVHHKFLALGLHHRSTVIILYVISLAWAAIAILFRNEPEYELLATFCVGSTAIFLALRRFLRDRGLLHEFYRNCADTPSPRVGEFGGEEAEG